MPEVQIPVFNAPERGLTDREIENTYVAPENRLDLYSDDNVIRPEVWNIPERNHQVVQPPVFELETLSHEQGLKKSIDAIPDYELVRDIAADMTAIGRNLSVERSRVQRNDSLPAAA